MFGFAPMKNLTALHRQCQSACLAAGRVLWRNVTFSNVCRICIQRVGSSAPRGEEDAMLISAPAEPESLGGKHWDAVEERSLSRSEDIST